MLLGWSSATTPLPIGVGRKGMPVLFMKLVIACSAPVIAQALPMTTSGFLAYFKVLRAITI